MRIDKLAILYLFLLITPFYFSGCVPQSEIVSVPVTIIVDGSEQKVEAEIGITIENLLHNSGINLGKLDRYDPSELSVITQPLIITVTRVREEFETIEQIIPFEQQTVRNESLPENQILLIQTGVNGKQTITYRLLFENDKLVSRTISDRLMSVPPKAEIRMIGVQSPFSALEMNGTLVYLSSGNAWLMEKSTANRKPLVTTGNLDGRILSLSPDKNWLLFTQKSEISEKINELWVININNREGVPVYLGVDNVIHFADWLPGLELKVYVSTVDPRETAPGWQANNDLIELNLGLDGNVVTRKYIISENSGGIYGWWGTRFLIDSSGKKIAVIRPDSLGLVDLQTQETNILYAIEPVQTSGEWSWLSPVSWSVNNDFIYFIDHEKKLESVGTEYVQSFSLKSIRLDNNQINRIIENTGMFSFSAPLMTKEANSSKILFLNAISPEKSDSSTYRLFISDRDGSNENLVFPNLDMQGILPQKILSHCELESDCVVSLIYQGNLWFLSLGEKIIPHQITGDGLISLIDWK